MVSGDSMNRWMKYLVLAVLVFGLPVTLVAQDAEAEAAAEPAEAEEDPAASLEEIDRLLAQEEAIYSGGGYTYDPGGRRDPFRSLLEMTTRDDNSTRPEGIPGLLIDDIVITGIFSTPEGMWAQVQTSTKDISYLLREGDLLYDGDVLRITAGEVVFKQSVNDPTILKPFREVVKALNP